jgi:leucyl aminopeptidase (aminopeptidase T)
MPEQRFLHGKTYADVILKVGLNLQAGQRLLVTGSIQGGVDIRLAPFVEILVERAYRCGASHVDVIWRDPVHDLYWLRNLPGERSGSPKNSSSRSSIRLPAPG